MVRLTVDGYYPEREIRTAQTSAAVPHVAAVPKVRQWMKIKQRECIKFGSLVMEGRDPASVAKELISGTKLDDVNVRKPLWEGGEAAIQASTYPLIVAMRRIEPEALASRKRYDDNVDAVVRRAE